MRNQKGFTLIELLVVIAIIGLLSAMAIVSLGSASKKANDAQVKSDLSQVRTYMTMTYDNLDYTGVTSVGVFGATKLTAPTCSVGGYLLTINATTPPNQWSATGSLCNVPGNYFCVDSSGQAKEEVEASSTKPIAGAQCP